MKNKPRKASQWLVSGPTADYIHYQLFSNHRLVKMP